VNQITDQKSAETIRLQIPEEHRGKRLDAVLTVLLPDHSRSAIQKWLAQGRVALSAGEAKKKFKVAGGETVEITPPEPDLLVDEAEPIPLHVVHEDEQLLVIDKPAGLVVHPGAGNMRGTLLNALLFHHEALAELPRAGIVHRLDKLTSGLLVVAKTELARQSLTDQLKTRSLKRQYIAVVNGSMVAGGTVDEPVGRHRNDRKRMVVRGSGRPSVTHYRVREHFRAHTALDVSLETGRTHQIRVHMTHIDHPLVGDPVYGKRLRIPPGADDELTDILRGFRRQALHAAKLGLEHPASGEYLEWKSPLPQDMRELNRALREDAEQHDPYRD